MQVESYETCHGQLKHICGHKPSSNLLQGKSGHINLPDFMKELWGFWFVLSKHFTLRYYMIPR